MAWHWAGTDIGKAHHEHAELSDRGVRLEGRASRAPGWLRGRGETGESSARRVPLLRGCPQPLPGHTSRYGASGMYVCHSAAVSVVFAWAQIQVAA
jgi:hypothetical protein